jgi:Leucine-rich repeat (LRR) protein
MKIFSRLASFALATFVTAHLVAASESDVVRIPDLKLRAYLLANAVDANGQGIRNAEGLQHFTNLKILNIEDNLLTAIDVSPLRQLERLSIRLNQITNLDVSPLKKLRELDARDNAFTALTIHDIPTLEMISLAGCSRLTHLQLGKLPNLKNLYVSHTALTALDLQGLSRLVRFEAAEVPLEDLRFGGNTELESFALHKCRLPRLDLNGLTGLKKIAAIECGLNEINVVGAPALEEAILDGNHFKSADFTAATRLRKLHLREIPTLMYLHVRGLRELEELDCFLLMEPRYYLPLNLSGTVKLRKLEW